MDAQAHARRVPHTDEDKNFTEMCCSNEVGSYLRLIDSCITRFKARGPCRICNESKEEEERAYMDARAHARRVPHPNIHVRAASHEECVGEHIDGRC